MSRLKVYWPVDGNTACAEHSPTAVCDSIPLTNDDDPPILSYSAFRLRRRVPQTENVAGRAHLLHANRHCPYCGHPIVEPLELRDAALNRNRLPIPGTATLVGFHCHDCQAEWPA